jgi:hypothetical protein
MYYSNKLLKGILIVFILGIFIVLGVQNIFAEEEAFSCTITS